VKNNKEAIFIFLQKTIGTVQIKKIPLVVIKNRKRPYYKTGTEAIITINGFHVEVPHLN
jgi:hypothetical protein